MLLTIGNARLIQLYGVEKGLQYGFWPFWKGAILKLFLATAGVFVANRMATPKALKES